MAIIGLIVLYVFEFQWLSNTFEAGKLIAQFAISGFVAGLILGWHYRYKAKDITEQIQIFCFFIFPLTLFAPLFGSLSNRLLSFHPVEMRQFEFFKETSFSGELGIFEGARITPDAYLVFFFRNGKLERIKSRKRLFPGIERGSFIDLPVRKGFWGYEYVALEK